MDSFGEYLRRLRTGRHLTMAQLAGRAGVAERSLRNWEQGRYEPGTAELAAVLAALGAGPEEQAQMAALLRSPRFHRPARSLPAPADATPLPAPPSLGDLIRALRWRKGVPRSLVVESLGIRPSTLSRWEQGTRLPSDDNLERLADLLAALPQERALLRQRHLQPGERAFLPLEELVEQVCGADGPLITPRDAAGDARALSLLAALWPRARSNPQTLLLLGRVAAGYALYLSYLARLPEAQRYVRLAASVLPRCTREMNALPYIQTIYAGVTVLNPAGDPALFAETVTHFQTWLPGVDHPSVRCYVQGLSAHYACRAGWYAEAEAFLRDAEQAHRQIPEGSDDWLDRGPLLANVRWQIMLLSSNYRRGWDQMPTILPTTHFASAANIHLSAARMHLGAGSRREAGEHLERAFGVIDQHRYDVIRPQAEKLAASLY